MYSKKYIKRCDKNKLETLLFDNIYNLFQVFEETLYFRKLSI